MKRFIYYYIYFIISKNNIFWHCFSILETNTQCYERYCQYVSNKIIFNNILEPAVYATILLYYSNITMSLVCLIISAIVKLPCIKSYGYWYRYSNKRKAHRKTNFVLINLFLNHWYYLQCLALHSLKLAHQYHISTSVIMIEQRSTDRVNIFSQSWRGGCIWNHKFVFTVIVKHPKLLWEDSAE